MQFPRFEYTYAALPDRFYERLGPTRFPAAQLVYWNEPLARDLGFDSFDWSLDERAQIFSAATLPSEAKPLAQAYSGHQFGRFNPGLGDGRAMLLGEVRDPKGRRLDIHLKGSGPTRFSRGGDGKATLSAALREAIVSESMHGLGIPTSRILAVILTGERIAREDGVEPGAIAVRVAASHLRVGTFEHFAARGDTEGLRTLGAYFLSRHHPDLEPSATGYREAFRRVLFNQARLVAEWLGVGFIHGVMNTDNTFLSGETLDYGPCAFLEAYDPAAVFSRIDQSGRYAYGRQPDILMWNLGILAECFEVLTGDPSFTPELETFPGLFQSEWRRVFAKKLNLSPDSPETLGAIRQFMKDLEAQRADFTQTFRMQGPQNPAVIARNHLVERAIRAALDTQDFSVMENLVQVVRAPNQAHPDFENPAEAHERVTSTHCNT